MRRRALWRTRGALWQMVAAGRGECDTDERRLWLDRISPEHEDSYPALRLVLVPENPRKSEIDPLVAAELAAANKGHALADPCLQPGDRIGPCELSLHPEMALAPDPINLPVAGADR